MTPKTKKEKTTSARRGGNPANLEKSRERTKQHLVPGQKPHRAMTIEELEYCAWRARGASIADSARFADIALGNAYNFEHRELTQQTIEGIKKEYKDSAVDRVDELRATMVTFAVGEWMRRMRTMETHPVRGDDSIVRGLDSAFKASGLIQPTKVIAQANAGAKADASNQLYAKRLYLPLWRRETIERLEKERLAKEAGESPQ